jgi:hypothetical protein
MFQKYLLKMTNEIHGNCKLKGEDENTNKTHIHFIEVGPQKMT